MKKILFSLLFAVPLLFLACQKEGDFSAEANNNNSNTNNGNNGGNTGVNSWTFTEGSHVFKGLLAFDPILVTVADANNTYFFGALGVETTTGYAFNFVITLSDTTFTNKTYYSGNENNEGSTSMYYSKNPSSLDPPDYFSSNLDPGAVMTYTVDSYDASKKVVTISFSGDAYDITHKIVKITRGKFVAKVDFEH